MGACIMVQSKHSSGRFSVRGAKVIMSSQLKACTTTGIVLHHTQQGLEKWQFERTHSYHMPVREDYTRHHV